MSDRQRLKRIAFPRPDPSTRALVPEVYEAQFPKGLLAFIDLFYDTGIREKVERMCHEGGVLHERGVNMLVRYCRALLKVFLATEFEDQSEYKGIADLPEKEVRRAINALGYKIGMNPHNGNHNLLDIYKKYYNSTGV